MKRKKKGNGSDVVVVKRQMGEEVSRIYTYTITAKR
jgi:hypothetical protein